MYRMIFSRVVLAAAVASLAVVSGCTWTGSSVSQTIDYQNARTRSTPLEVPPDLSQLPRDERFTVPERPQTVTASATAASRPGGPAGAPGAATAAMVAPTATVARIERAGNQRWLAVNMPPDKAWPILLEFWPSVGLAVEKSDPATGVMETVWAENKAKVNQDLIRRSLGRIFSSVYETGEQDKYRARIERTATDTSEIFISHRGMIEVFTSSQQDRTAWQPRPPDPGLEAEMLQRLLAKFDGTASRPAASAKAPAAAGAPAAGAAATVAAAPEAAWIIKGADGRSERLVIDDAFDRAWRRVGLALDRGGFTVEDRDRAKGTYFVRYLDPDYEAKAKDEQGFLTKILGKEKPVPAPQYRVQVSASGQAGTQVQVFDKDGKPERSAAGDRILALLSDQLR
jgi:outer membrane protein assembly factor BamC